MYCVTFVLLFNIISMREEPIDNEQWYRVVLPSFTFFFFVEGG